MEYNNSLPHYPAMGPYPYPYDYSNQFVPPSAVADQDPTVNDQMTQQQQAAAAREIMENRVRMVDEQQGMCSDDVAATSEHKEEIEMWIDPNLGANHENNGMETMIPNIPFESQTLIGRFSGVRAESAFSPSSTLFGLHNAISPPAGIGSTRRRAIASANTDTKSVISTAGSINRRCHGHSVCDVSIFDLFPSIGIYQREQYSEKERIDFLLSYSQKPFRGVNGGPLLVNETEMWFMALKYLFNYITSGQFDSMTDELRFVVKRYMETHKRRFAFFNSIRKIGFISVLSTIRRKMPKENIRKEMERERRKADGNIMNMIKRQKTARNLVNEHRATIPVSAQVAATAAPITAPPPGFCAAPPMASAMDLNYNPPPTIPLELGTAVPVQPSMTPLAPRLKRYTAFPPARPPRHQRRGRSLIGQRSVSAPDLTPFAAWGLPVDGAPPAATYSGDALNDDEIEEILSEIDREIGPDLLRETGLRTNRSRGSGMTGALHRANAPAAGPPPGFPFPVVPRSQFGSMRNTRSVSDRKDAFFF